MAHNSCSPERHQDMPADSSSIQEGAAWYLRTDETQDGEEAEIDQRFFRVEGRQGAWWLIRLIGSMVLLVLTRHA